MRTRRILTDILKLGFFKVISSKTKEAWNKVQRRKEKIESARVSVFWRCPRRRSSFYFAFCLHLWQALRRKLVAEAHIGGSATTYVYTQNQYCICPFLLKNLVEFSNIFNSVYEKSRKVVTNSSACSKVTKPMLENVDWGNIENIKNILLCCTLVQNRSAPKPGKA